MLQCQTLDPYMLGMRFWFSTFGKEVINDLIMLVVFKLLDVYAV